VPNRFMQIRATPMFAGSLPGDPKHRRMVGYASNLLQAGRRKRNKAVPFLLTANRAFMVVEIGGPGRNRFAGADQDSLPPWLLNIRNTALMKNAPPPPRPYSSNVETNRGCRKPGLGVKNDKRPFAKGRIAADVNTEIRRGGGG